MFGPTPFFILAVRSLASLDEPERTKTALKRFRTAVWTTLAAAGVDMTGVLEQTTQPFEDASRHHALVVWYDVAAGALRLFAPRLDVLDPTSEQALKLISGSIVMDLSKTPIEDVDATARVMSLMSVGGEDAADVHSRFIAPHVDRYDDDFAPQTVADLEAVWGRMFPFYFGGDKYPPKPCDVWIDRVYAFGVGWVAPVKKKKATRKKKAPAKKRRR